MSVISNNISAEDRREIYYKLYFKIIISMSEPTFADIARNSGYVIKTVTQYIKANKDLLALMEKNYSIFNEAEDIKDKLEDSRVKINRLNDQLVINHISRVKKSYNNYRRFSEKEQKRIIDKIIQLYQ